MPHFLKINGRGSDPLLGQKDWVTEANTSGVQRRNRDGKSRERANGRLNGVNAKVKVNLTSHSPGMYEYVCYVNAPLGICQGSLPIEGVSPRSCPGSLPDRRRQAPRSPGVRWLWFGGRGGGGISTHRAHLTGFLARGGWPRPQGPSGRALIKRPVVPPSSSPPPLDHRPAHPSF